MEPASALGPKTFVLDTSVLIHDATALTSFEDNDIVLARVTIRELDGLKKGADDVARNARHVSKMLFELTGGYPDRIGRGMPLPPPAKGHLRILDPGAEHLDADHQIIELAKQLKLKNEPIVLVSKDLLLIVDARIQGLIAEDYTTDKISLEEFYTGYSEIVVPTQCFFMDNRGTGRRECELPDKFHEQQHYPNECVFLKSESNPEWSVRTFYDHESDALRLMTYKRMDIKKYKVVPRNVEQWFAYELCKNPDIPFVTEVGVAGTGKDVIALRAGLEGIDEKRYKQIILASSAVPLDNIGVGFLPGNLQRKVEPWMEPFFHNIELLLGPDRGDKSKKGAGQPWRELVDSGVIRIVSASHIRGTTYDDSYVIVTEAQNLSPLAAKTIATRIGERSKMIFTGDIHQIDNPRVDATSCGLTRIVERFKESRLAGHIRLIKTERSEAAELAAKVL